MAAATPGCIRVRSPRTSRLRAGDGLLAGHEQLLPRRGTDQRPSALDRPGSSRRADACRGPPRGADQPNSRAACVRRRGSRAVRTPSGRLGRPGGRPSARSSGLADDDPPAAVLLWNVIPEYRVLIADGLLGRPLFDVSPGALSFDALERYFAGPGPACPTAPPPSTAPGWPARSSSTTPRPPRAAADARDPGPRHPQRRADRRRPPAGRAGRRLVIGTSARISPQKRLDSLIDAVCRASRSCPLTSCASRAGSSGAARSTPKRCGVQAQRLAC